MPIESPGQSGTQGLAIPTGTRARLAWRPPAVRAAQSLLPETPHLFSALWRAGRLLEWHERLTHRFRPWLGLEQPRIERGVEIPGHLGSMTFGTALRPGWAGQQPPSAMFAGVVPLDPEQREGRTGTAPPWAAQIQGALDRQMEGTQRVRLAHPPIDHNPGIPIAAPVGREVIRLRLQPGVEARGEPDREGPLDMTSPGRTFASMAQSPEPPQEPLPRLQLSVSAAPRRELTGEFPRSEPVVSGHVMAKATAESEPRPLAAETSPPGWEAARQSIAASALRTPAHAFGEIPQIDSVVEKVIERTHEAVPMPGLEIRLIRPSERETSDQRQRADERDRATPSAPAPSAPPAPQLDINAVADKVYQTLVRRQQFERERKGLY